MPYVEPTIDPAAEDLSNAGNRRAAQRRAARDAKRKKVEPELPKDFSDGEHVEIEVDADEDAAVPMTRARRRKLARQIMGRETRMRVRKAKTWKVQGL